MAIQGPYYLCKLTEYQLANNRFSVVVVPFSEKGGRYLLRGEAIERAEYLAGKGYDVYIEYSDCEVQIPYMVFSIAMYELLKQTKATVNSANGAVKKPASTLRARRLRLRGEPLDK